MKPVITLQKTAWTVTHVTGDDYTENGRSYFSKDVARANARRIGGMYQPASNRTSVKEVITGYQEDGQ